MPEIKIKIRDKRAGGTGTVICGNSDYTVVWDLDDEWTPYGTKTMRVNLADGTYQDVVFSGDTAALPVLSTPGWASVGLYAGDLHTSRAADLRVLPSVTTPGGAPADPAEDVYDQLTEKLNRLIAVQPESVAQAVADYLTEHPAVSSMRVEGGYIQFSGDGKNWDNGQSEGAQGRNRSARPRRVRRQLDGFLHCRRNGPVGAVRRRPDCGGYRRGGRTPCQLEEKSRRHSERLGLRGQGRRQHGRYSGHSGGH